METLHDARGAEVGPRGPGRLVTKDLLATVGPGAAKIVYHDERAPQQLEAMRKRVSCDLPVAHSYEELADFQGSGAIVTAQEGLDSHVLRNEPEGKALQLLAQEQY